MFVHKQKVALYGLFNLKFEQSVTTELKVLDWFNRGLTLGGGVFFEWATWHSYQWSQVEASKLSAYDFNQ